MKKVLLTNFNMVNYTGSELDTLTMAQYFLKNNYEVSIFTIEYGYPLLKEIDDKIKLYDYSRINLMDQHFDLIWSHHYPLLDYLLFTKKIGANYICYISLSSYIGYESYPIYYKDLNYLAIVSKEALDLATDEGYETKNINIFTNYSFQKYFNKKVNLSNKLENICIVSNHIPKEIIDMKEIFSSNNINVDIYGMGYKYQKIDDKLLSKYDLIISIGKTINYGISLGIPCYCYDRFGGDGYITLDIIEKSYEYNFSGRYLQIKKTGEELYKDITKNYKKVLKDTLKIKKYGYENFCYEKMMENTLKQIYNSNKFDINKLLKKYPIEIRKSSLFLDVVGSQTEILKQYNHPFETCQFYYDFGDGFNERNSKKTYYMYLDQNNYYVKVKIPNNVHRIRFDYSEKSLTKLNSIEINQKIIPLNDLINTINYGDKYISINNDPSIILHTEEKELEIKVNMQFLDSEEVINKFESDINSLNMIIQKMENKKPKNIIKRILKRLLKR